MRAHFSDKEIVVLAFTIAQANFWTRFNQGLGVPASGLFDESVCRLPERGHRVARRARTGLVRRLQRR